MVSVIGVWRLVEARAWDEAGNSLAAPYGENPVGHITFTAQGRMLAALCNGDPDPSGNLDRSYSSYGGTYTLSGDTLTTLVDVAADPLRIGTEQVRKARMSGERLVLRPPLRSYAGVPQQRELEWEKIWAPD